MIFTLILTVFLSIYFSTTPAIWRFREFSEATKIKLRILMYKVIIILFSFIVLGYSLAFNSYQVTFIITIVWGLCICILAMTMEMHLAERLNTSSLTAHLLSVVYYNFSSILPGIFQSFDFFRVLFANIEFFKHHPYTLFNVTSGLELFDLFPTNTHRLRFLSQPVVFWRIPLFFRYKLIDPTIRVMYTQHLLVFYNFFKTTLIVLLCTLIYFVYMIFFFKIQFLKQLSVWFVIGMLAFWLFSGFNFFLKRYQYGKFTSQIQRFWKRTNVCFWLIEGFLMLLFFYYYLNSSQEPVYMYDFSSLNQEYLISLTTISSNIILLSLVIYFMYATLLKINFNNWPQLNAYLGLISVFIFSSFFVETYQFYYVLSTFNERLWIFSEEENLWTIEIDNPILRTKQQYLLVCLIAKYWHFLFIFLSWVFFLLKSFERRKVTYVLFGANLQNFIILYALNFACYLQWFKWIYRRFFDLPYTWFMTNGDNKLIFRLFLEIKLIVINFFSTNLNFSTYTSLIHKSLNLWESDSLAIWKFI